MVVLWLLTPRVWLSGSGNALAICDLSQGLVRGEWVPNKNVKSPFWYTVSTLTQLMGNERSSWIHSSFFLPGGG